MNVSDSKYSKSSNTSRDLKRISLTFVCNPHTFLNRICSRNRLRLLSWPYLIYNIVDSAFPENCSPCIRNRGIIHRTSIVRISLIRFPFAAWTSLLLFFRAVNRLTHTQLKPSPSMTLRNWSPQFVSLSLHVFPSFPLLFLFFFENRKHAEMISFNTPGVTWTTFPWLANTIIFF